MASGMLRTDVYDQLKERLFSGELRAGQVVSQRELTELLGATLNPVREAIRKLEAEGLINVYAQRGIQIIEGNPKAINDAYDYRRLLETDAVRFFVSRATDSDIEAMTSKVNASLAKLARKPHDRGVRLGVLDDDFAFHKALIDFQDNAIISRHYSLNAARLRLFRINIGEPLQRLELAANEHLAILGACKKREAEAAARLLGEHIEISREHTLGLRAVR
jgi:DNA-binding GntR family transcriptional regulator